MMGLLRSIGIEKGKAFRPDAATQAVLKQGIEEAHAWFMDRLVTYGEHYWPDGKWDTIVDPIGPKSGFSWETPVTTRWTRAASASLASSRRR